MAAENAGGPCVAKAPGGAGFPRDRRLCGQAGVGARIGLKHVTIFSRVNGKNGGGDDLLRFKPVAGDKLCFWIFLKNTAAINFNQLPVTYNNAKMFYFTNQLTDGGALRGNLHLTASASGVNESADTVVKMSSSYSYHHTAVVLAGTAVVKHSITGAEVEPKTIINQAASADLYFDLSLLPEGNCQLFINHIEEDAFYYMGSNPPQAFGVIELLLAPSLDANYRIAEADRSIITERPFYTLHFINRPTLWRYNIELGANSPLFLEISALPDAPALNNKTDFINSLKIITNDSAITFAPAVASPDGTSFKFVSNAPVGLQEKYISSSSITKDALSLTLKKYVGLPAEAVVKSDLQCPSTGTIDASNNPMIYSDILITI